MPDSRVKIIQLGCVQNGKSLHYVGQRKDKRCPIHREKSPYPQQQQFEHKQLPFSPRKLQSPLHVFHQKSSDENKHA